MAGGQVAPSLAPKLSAREESRKETGRKASEMTPDQLVIKLLVQNSKLRVLDEVSRQAMADLKTIEASQPKGNKVSPISQATAWE